jgi:hypothetical protein
MLRAVPSTFENADHEHPPVLSIVVREDIDESLANEALDLIARHDWERLSHAYGTAADAPAQLAAVVVGDTTTRARAWWNLWGNIWHQGTVYSATAPAVPVLATVARWEDHPDRVQAFMMLREIAAGYGAAKAAVDAVLEVALPPLFERWIDEPEVVKRVLLWTLSASPALRAEHPALVEAVLLDEHREAWSLAITAGWETDEQFDAYCEFEAWATEGAEHP